MILEIYDTKKNSDEIDLSLDIYVIGSGECKRPEMENQKIFFFFSRIYGLSYL